MPRDGASACLDVQDARTVRRAGARFASDLAGAAWARFMVALGEQGDRLRRAVLDAGHTPEQARLSRSDPSRRAKCRRAFRGAAHFEAAARDEWVWLEAATGTDRR